jgi:hypothetical protein
LEISGLSSRVVLKKTRIIRGYAIAAKGKCSSVFMALGACQDRSNGDGAE